MKTKPILYIVILLTIITFRLNSQSCLPNGITFTSQQEIDNFANNYPGCTEILGYVSIYSPDDNNIVNLNGLSQITAINGNLSITHNYSLSNFSGLDNLETIGGKLNVQNNWNLTSVSELNSLISIGESVYFDSVDDLVDLNGFASLTSIGDFLYISYNDGLEEINGFNNLISVGGRIWIHNNSTLNIIDGFENLEISDDLLIKTNNNLTSITGFENLNSTNDFTIYNNELLTNVNNFNNLETVEGDFNIVSNESLSEMGSFNALTSIGVTLQIRDNLNLLSLPEMNSLATIGERFYIVDNNSLTTFTDFDALTTIGEDFVVSNNTALENLGSFNSLETIGTGLSINYCSSLNSLTGLNNLNSIGGYLSIRNNAILESLNGLEGIESIGGYLKIHDNPSLFDIDAISNIDPQTIKSNYDDDLIIYENEMLSECAVINICEFMDIPGRTKDIHDNASGCNSVSEIETACQELLCSDLVSPFEGEMDVNINTDISWSEALNAVGYYITIGTSSGGNDIADNIDVGSVTVYDPNGLPCASDIFVLISPYDEMGNIMDCAEESFTTEEVTADAGADTEFCAGGSVQLNATGGTTYSWSPTDGLDDPNIANPVASPDATTTYTVTVSNDGRCPDTDDVLVTVNPNPVPNATATDETANDANDGTATSNPTSGTPGYSYNWSNGETTQTITDLSPGNYTITVTDSKTCTGEETVTVAEYICPTITLSESITNTTCNEDCDGSITVTPSGGTAPYTYSWSNGQTTQTATGLCAGSYTVTVTDSKNCSVVSGSYTVSEPDELLANASATDETGNDFEDGTATSAPSGGTSPYTYAWSNGETTQTVTGLAPGNYTVTVTDAHSCTAEETVTVNEYICAVLTIEETQENVSCYGECDGILTVDDVTNGIQPYDYEWNTGETTQSIDNLCPGSYDVTVTDSKNCSVSESYTITEPDELSANASATDETANDANDGTATATPSGGTTPYSYEWSTGETTQTIEDLAPGDYDVTVTDDNGCTSEETVTVNEFVCPDLSLESSQFDNTCYNECDGEITITNVINGVAPFTYEWTDGQTGQTAYELCAGDYDVTVTDSKNCSAVSETFTITEPEELTATTTTTGETYNDAEDGTATVNANGGTTPYSYLWDTGETTQTITNLAPAIYYVTVTDDNGCTVEAEAEVEEFICPTLTILEETENVYCNGDCDGYISIYAIDNGVAPFEYLWNTGDTESTIDNLCPDTYSVTVTDADNCPITKTYEITEPDELLVNTTATDETEYGAQDGTAIANPTGGTSPYDYEWSTGATTQSITNLAPGNYIVTVTDYYNCQSIDMVTVNEFICPDLTVNATQTNINCYGACNGEIEVTSVTNAVEPLYYEWSNGGGASYIDNLCPGDYTVTVTDAKNCQVIQDYTITQPEELLANASATDETANDANDGTATANPTGGDSPYSYAWSNGESTQTITGLAPGSYTVTVTDNNGCTSIESVSVAEFGCLGLAIEISQTNVQCNSECNGILEVTGVTNGTSPFTYTWSNGYATAKIDSLCPGSYSVTVVDGNNCNVYGSYTITEPQPLSANAISTDETSNNANDGTAISNPSGGTQAYAYSWSTGDTTQAISGLAPGSYFLTVTDANGCTALDTVTIIEFTCPALEVNYQTSNISCFGACDGSIAVLSVNNAVSPLSYKWNTGATSASMSDLCAGDYSVTITDAKNCEIVQNYSLTQPDEITITVDSTRDVRLDPLGYIAITTNNNGNYIFSWTGPGNFTAKTEDLDSLSDFGCYTLTVTDTTTNCSSDSTICLEDKTATFDFELGNINIYPNPAKNDFIIDFSNTKLSNAEITLFDLSGKIQLQLEKQAKDRILKVDSETLNAGLYIIRIRSAEYGITYRKIVLSK